MDTNIYEEAIKDIKSILYDIITLEQDNLQTLEEKLSSQEDIDKENLEEKISLKKKTLSSLRKDTLSIEKNIELLDKSNDNIDFIYVDSEEKNDDLQIEDISTEEKEYSPQEENNIENTQIISENENEIIVEKEEPLQEDSVEDNSIKEIEEVVPNENEIEDRPITPEIEDNTIEEQQNLPQEEDIIKDTDTTQEKEENTSQENDIEKDVLNNQEINTESEINTNSPKMVKYTFTKTSKNITKAILVTKEQSERLAKSQEKQIYIQKVKENLKDLKDLSNNIDLVKNQALIEQQQFNEELTELLNTQKAQGIPQERQIEDLMVKANIYTNEGETDKAQAIYDKINELQNGDQKQKIKEEPIILKAA